MAKKKQEILKEEKDGKRVYLIGDERYSSVTSVFKSITVPALALWEERVGKDLARIISAKAADKGTKIHKVCEKIASEFSGRAKRVRVPKEFKVHGDLFTEWLRDNVLKVVLIEQVVFSKTYLLAGQLDFGFVTKQHPEGLTILDIKTGKIKPIAELQMASYAKLLEESFPDIVKEYPIADRLILPIPRNIKGVIKLEAIPCPDPIEADWEIYKALLVVYRWQERKEHGAKV